MNLWFGLVVDAGGEETETPISNQFENRTADWWKGTLDSPLCKGPWTVLCNFLDLMGIWNTFKEFVKDCKQAKFMTRQGQLNLHKDCIKSPICFIQRKGKIMLFLDGSILSEVFCTIGINKVIYKEY